MREFIRLRNLVDAIVSLTYSNLGLGMGVELGTTKIEDMSDISITRDDGIAEFETHLQSGRLAGSTLVLPNDIRNGGAIGASLAFTQFLLTWARANPAGTIKTFLSPSSADDFTTFTARAHGLAAAYFAERVLPLNSTVNIRQHLLESAKPRIVAMHNADLPNTARGPEIEMLLVQGARAEFHGSLYSSAPDSAAILNREVHGQHVRCRNDMNAFVARCVSELSLEKYFSAQLRKGSQPFGALLHEAFRNTAEHGYQAANGTRLLHNLRCVRLAQSLSNRDDISRMTVSSPASAITAERYFSAVAKKNGVVPRAKMKFFELSIFDSGPGFAPTINSGKSITDGTDRDAVARCFKKHQTAKSTTAAGLGLSRIMDVVESMAGFLRIRTNTVEAFYAPGAGLTLESQPREFVHDGLAPVEGSLVTIGIPVIH